MILSRPIGRIRRWSFSSLGNRDFGFATATGLSAMLGGDISHDQLTRYLSAREYTSKDLWGEDKKEGRFVRFSQLELADQQAVRVWLKGFPQEVLFVRRVFTNKDGSIGTLNLVCSDLACNGEQVATI